MKFFNRFPTVEYKFGSLKTSDEYTNLSVYADLFDSIKDDSSLYTYVDIRDGERPDLLADRLYGDSSLAWTFLFMNDDARLGSWALGYNDFQDVVAETMLGQCLTVRETETNSDGDTVLKMTSRFINGSTVYGSSSTAYGVVRARNANLAQLFITVTSGTFIDGETIQNAIPPSSPTESLVVSEAMLTSQAAHHYEDEDGEYVDIDPTTGIVPAIYTEITYEEELDRRNSGLSRVRALRGDVVRQVAMRFRDIIDS